MATRARQWLLSQLLQSERSAEQIWDEARAARAVGACGRRVEGHFAVHSCILQLCTAKWYIVAYVSVGDAFGNYFVFALRGRVSLPHQMLQPSPRYSAQQFGPPSSFLVDRIVVCTSSVDLANVKFWTFSDKCSLHSLWRSEEDARSKETRVLVG
eukprot:6209795-Pleurochrysis_carterae.AAC.1